MTIDAGGPEQGPRYHQVTRILQQRIEAGAYPIGGTLPTEVELCRQFAVSRHTIREALRRLTGAGLVARRQGSGTQVVARTSPSTYVQSIGSVSELFQYAADTDFTIDHVEDISADETLAATLGHPDCRRWLFVQGLRAQPDGTPICLSHVYLHESLMHLRDRLPGNRLAIYTLIEEATREKIRLVLQEFRAEPMPKAFLRPLRSSPKIWAVRVVRRYMGSDGKPLEVSINYHPADRFHYAMHLRREDFS